ncbi:fimbrial protein [Caballeronia sp. LZ032]|uniref:fimbrial protein n=1 Tax=Caballeronia sp. LZ032 TaxID=3038565 RepID=UPI00285C895B|nr:fimbrial protein [Caballeronia sp. LZ032]MDR5882559.1 fimbrial protein [Caballeronia sp. LZ032]
MRVMGRAVRAWIRCVLYCVGVLAISPGHVWATASCHSNPPWLYTLNFPARVAVARDLPNGSPLTGWVSTPLTTNYWTCNQSESWFTGTDFEAAGIIPTTPTSYTRSYNGVSFPVYATNVPGVGMALGGVIYTNGRTRGPFGFPQLGYQWNQNGTAVNNGGQLIGSLVKIGSVTPGTVSGQLAQAFSWESALKTQPPGNLDFSAGVINFDMTPVIITVLTCQTPDVNVDMGTQTPADFPGLGAPSSKSRSFNLAFNNCPAGVADSTDPASLSGLIHSVQYRIDPISPDRLVSGYSNVVALDSGTSQAGGVGIQLYDSTGTVLPLATYMPLNGFDGTKANSYSLSMKASYFRIGAISPGTANATLLMTVQYQ